MQPDQLFDDPHLNEPGAMVHVTLANGRDAPLPALPLEIDGKRLGLRLDLPRAGEHSAAIARQLGYDQGEIDRLIADGVMGVDQVPA
jgi:crotonobetainyl-CoA:carnitine CoA-transferase CaiB-like acyl-CoA transferase